MKRDREHPGVYGAYPRLTHPALTDALQSCDRTPVGGLIVSKLYPCRKTPQLDHALFTARQHPLPAGLHV